LKGFLDEQEGVTQHSNDLLSVILRALALGKRWTHHRC
jgi:hypothetical protein